MFGSTASPTHGTGFIAIASEIAQNRLRQAMTSPSIAWLPRKSSAPVARSAFAITPARKSSLTAKRVQPCNWKPLLKPERG